MVRQPAINAEKLRPLLYPDHGQVSRHTSNSIESFPPKLLLFSLLNNMKLPGTMTLDELYSWLERIPSSDMLQFIQSVPAPFSWVLAERIFVVAVETGNAYIIEGILRSGSDPYECNCWPDHTCEFTSLDKPFPHSICISIKQERFEATKVILLCTLQRMPKDVLEELLQQVLRKSAFVSSQKLRLVRLILEVGAVPEVRHICAALRSQEIMQVLFEWGDKSPLLWIKAGLLEKAFDDYNIIMTNVENKRPPWIVHHILKENIHQLPLANPEISLALSRAFKIAVKHRDVRSAKLILDSGVSLSVLVELDDEEHGGANFDHITHASPETAVDLSTREELVIDSLEQASISLIPSTSPNQRFEYDESHLLKLESAINYKNLRQIDTILAASVSLSCANLYGILDLLIRQLKVDIGSFATPYFTQNSSFVLQPPQA